MTASAHAPDSGHPITKPEDISPSQASAFVLGLMMIALPALGVPSIEVFQDTLKSAIAAIMTLGAGLFFFWMRRTRATPLVWHAVMGLPLLLAIYALGSMFWSHAYLAGVELTRWLLLGVLLWLGANMRLDHVEKYIFSGIHWGVCVASVWTALQFWGDFQFFPQIRAPASTFINRNFFAEYAICALPFSVLVLLRARNRWMTLSLAAMVGFNVVALMMTGTRSALVGLVVLIILGPFIYKRCQQQLAMQNWSTRRKQAAGAVFLGIVVSLGSIQCKNASLLAESGPMTAISRSITRTASIADTEEYTRQSFSVRLVLWAETLRMIVHNPIAGVGAGAWEVQVPLYQKSGSQLETDYFVHNDYLQTVAEYGLVGWLFLVLLISYVAYSIRRFWTDQTASGWRVAPLRAAALCSMTMFLIIAGAGFPLRMAGTCVFFALNLALLALCDAQGTVHPYVLDRFFQCKTVCNQAATAFVGFCLLLAVYITQQAAECEMGFVEGIQLAWTIAQAGNTPTAQSNETKAEALKLLRRAISINPHYRKLAPYAAEQLQKMGDWENALWIWKSVYQSRPYVVVVLMSAAHADMELGRLDEAQLFIAKALQIQPTLANLRTMNAILLFRNGEDARASQAVKDLFNDHVVDHDLARTAYLLGERTADIALTIKALEVLKHYWPGEAADAWLKLGNIYANDPGVRDDAQALAAYRSAVQTSQPSQKTETMVQIPPAYRSRL